MQYHTEVNGSGAVAQGTGATAVGAGGVYIGGTSQHNTIVTGSGQQVQGGSRPIDDCRPLQPGDRIECPGCEQVVTLTMATCHQFSARKATGQFARYRQGNGRPFSCPSCGRAASEANGWFIQQSTTGGAVAQGPGATAVAPGAVYRADGVYSEVIDTGTGNLSKS